MVTSFVPQKIHFLVTYSHGYVICISKNTFPCNIFPWLRHLSLKKDISLYHIPVVTSFVSKKYSYL